MVEKFTFYALGNSDKRIKLEYNQIIVIIRVKVILAAHHSAINKYSQINYDCLISRLDYSPREVQLEFVLSSSHRMLSRLSDSRGNSMEFLLKMAAACWVGRLT